ncbi:hypothetical protein HUT16_08260 [Kitasatospora sp. NA04385]|uniref:hypothetical protein n=1 Tax=Kitasatospora sp. NA04385 TaxID=2742135 RepID=UPI001591049B|nr:hypothetical protein [Kitasatospora sp. NA04385]QKW19057.1 hypothetical protein HUT16_08260 [Kitasatospora sp. NA04385]
MTDDGQLEPAGPDEGSIDLLTAALRRDAADLETYAQVLAGALVDALPADAVAVERRRSLADRAAGRPGRIERLDVSTDDRRLSLTVTRGRATAEVCQVVRGVVLSRRPVPLDEWTRELAAAITDRARSDARARAALERLLLGG